MSEKEDQPEAGARDGDRKKLFVISPIGNDASDERKHADELFDFVISEVAEPMGYECGRADKLPHSGSITQQIIERIVGDDVVIADLSMRNPNVFYELALRHAVQKPFVHMIREGELPPFDVQSNRAIFFDLSSLRSVYKAKAELAKQLESIQQGRPTDSPFSVHARLESLENGPSAEGGILAELARSVEYLRSDVAVLRDGSTHWDNYRANTGKTMQGIIRRAKSMKTYDEITTNIVKSSMPRKLLEEYLSFIGSTMADLISFENPNMPDNVKNELWDVQGSLARLREDLWNFREQLGQPTSPPA